MSVTAVLLGTGMVSRRGRAVLIRTIALSYACVEVGFGCFPLAF
jgi:hypothetical protein